MYVCMYVGVCIDVCEQILSQYSDSSFMLVD